MLELIFSLHPIVQTTLILCITFLILLGITYKPSNKGEKDEKDK